MSEFIVVTTPYAKPSSISGHTPDAHRVIGITPDRSSTLLEHGYTLDGSERERMVELSDEITERIIDFFDQTFKQRPLERPFYNCHSFAYFALGKITKLRRYNSFDGAFLPGQMMGSPLIPGETYCTKNPLGFVNHSLLATDASGENVSVLGDSQPLVIMSSEDIVKYYDAVDLAQFLPTAAY